MLSFAPLLASLAVVTSAQVTLPSPGSTFNMVNWKTYQSGINSRVTQRTMTVMDNRADFVRYWQNSLGQDPNSAPTDINWASEVLVAIHLGTRSTGGYSVFVKTIARGTDNYARISAIEQTPGAGQPVVQMVTSPYTIIRVTKGSFRFSMSLAQKAGNAFNPYPNNTGGRCNCTNCACGCGCGG